MELGYTYPTQAALMQRKPRSIMDMTPEEIQALLPAPGTYQATPLANWQSPMSVPDNPLLSPGQLQPPPRPIGELQQLSRDDWSNLPQMSPAELQALLAAGPAPQQAPQQNATQAHLASLEGMPTEELRKIQLANPLAKNLTSTEAAYNTMTPEQQGRVTAWEPNVAKRPSLPDPKIAFAHPNERWNSRSLAKQQSGYDKDAMAKQMGYISPEDQAALLAAGEKKFIDKKQNDGTPYWGDLQQEKPAGSSIGTSHGYLPYHGQVGVNPAELEKQYLSGKMRGDENILTPEEMAIMQNFTQKRDARLAAKADRKESARAMMQERALGERYAKDLQRSGPQAMAMAQMKMKQQGQQPQGGMANVDPSNPGQMAMPQPPDPLNAMINPQLYAAELMSFNAAMEQLNQNRKFTNEDRAFTEGARRFDTTAGLQEQDISLKRWAQELDAEVRRGALTLEQANQKYQQEKDRRDHEWERDKFGISREEGEALRNFEAQQNANKLASAERVAGITAQGNQRPDAATAMLAGLPQPLQLEAAARSFNLPPESYAPHLAGVGAVQGGNPSPSVSNILKSKWDEHAAGWGWVTHPDRSVEGFVTKMIAEGYPESVVRQWVQQSKVRDATSGPKWGKIF